MISFAVLLGLAAGCGADAVARIDGIEIAMTDLRAELAAMLGNAAYVEYLERTTQTRIEDPEELPELAADVLTISLTAVVLEEELERRKIALTEADRMEGELEASANSGRPSIFSRFPAWYREGLVRRATARAALRRTFTRGMTAESYFEEHRQDFMRSCTRHILVRSMADADAARSRILGGESFAAVARDVSLDVGSGPKGGDLGCNSRGHLVGPLDKAAMSQAVGRVGPPIRTDDGYHLLLVESREIPPLDQIRNRVGGAIVASGRKQMERVARRRLEGADVWVSDRIGRWSGTEVVAR